jgi:hypothetical protein
MATSNIHEEYPIALNSTLLITFSTVPIFLLQISQRSSPLSCFPHAPVLAFPGLHMNWP